MKIDKKFKVERAVSKNDDPTDSKTKIFIRNEDLVATDGRIIAFIPIELEEGDSHRIFIDPYIITEARKFAKEAESDFLTMNLAGEDSTGKVIFKNGITIPYQLTKTELELIPTEFDSIVPDGKPRISLVLDLNHLSKISAALGSRLIKLDYFDPHKAMRITPLVTDSKEVGFIAAFNGNDN